MLKHQWHLIGTVRSNRTGFPAPLKNAKDFERHGNCGDVCYISNNDVMYRQWLDERGVTLLSTKHQATARNDAQHTVRVDGEWQQQSVWRPEVVADYNAHMGSVDGFDHLASTYILLRCSKKVGDAFSTTFSSVLSSMHISSLDAFDCPSGYLQDDFWVQVLICGRVAYSSLSFWCKIQGLIQITWMYLSTEK